MSHETPHIADRADNDPREDPEALLIAALLWNRDTTQAVNLTQTLTPADFYSTDYAAIFATISQQLKSGRPYDPASVRTALHAEGDQSGILTDNIDALITMLTNLEHIPPKITDYAEAVASNSYRRQYRHMVEREVSQVLFRLMKPVFETTYGAQRTPMPKLPQHRLPHQTHDSGIHTLNRHPKRPHLTPRHADSRHTFCRLTR
ncbi:DnaB-like helicase N-terminal domain-containing protein [Corynebacterium striatum]|uniref:DnaB-like helicase N-terminal domain-containing protein n=1 Tax=Corynebacterium striatum TaxID=43770 RepID=UPI00194F775E|nr:DnaB-like helicase N-terminal domain-containing protein [Corynebacterium striatum]QRP19170.1 hypothetical protein I6J27_01630 [Corynebacterium striatum]